jgi:formylglycine-generating enzyme required for sulfatase activity
MTSEYEAHLNGDGALAQGEGAIAASGGSVAVGHDVHGDVIVNVHSENVRDKELAYLDAVLERYKYWRDHYTPLAGVAEIHKAIGEGPRLDLPVPFTPQEFEKLVECGYGLRPQIKREPVQDLRTAVRKHRHIILLGESGSGKTTTLWRLAYDYAMAARKNPRAPLPVFVPLGSYTADESFESYVGRCLKPLESSLTTYWSSGRLVLLLDGLNEMPEADRAKRVRRIQEALEWHTDGIVIITCRSLDYTGQLRNLHKIEVMPLDPRRIRVFLHTYLGKLYGEKLFWHIAGEQVRNLWKSWRRAGGSWEGFWSATEAPYYVHSNSYWPRTAEQKRLWLQLHRELPPLLEMGCNPYLLLMMAKVAEDRGRLPSNRAQMFQAFVNTLLKREERRHPRDWIATDRQKQALATLAYTMQMKRGRGTTVEREWAEQCIRQALPDCDARRILYLTTSAMLLDTDETEVRFYHQLLQEYFAACEMGQRVASGTVSAVFWPADHWWEATGWEETVLLAIGKKEYAEALLGWLVRVNPLLAARCVFEGNPEVEEEKVQSVAHALVPFMTHAIPVPKVRSKVGRALAQLGDPRRGVGLDNEGRPDIVWCSIPAGVFSMGSLEEDEMAYEDEKPRHQHNISKSYAMSRYPVTNVQYASFVQAGGYRKRRYWTEAGWSWRINGNICELEKYKSPFNLPNHPVVEISWYEAIAFSHWLTEELRQYGELTVDQNITLPTEPQWEKAARGTDGRRYTWGDKPDPNLGNYTDTRVGTTSAVGCFQRGASPYGVEDLSGNVMEWCRTKWNDDYQISEMDHDLRGCERRSLRGGAFFLRAKNIRCPTRFWLDPSSRSWYIGFRLVMVHARLSDTE